MRWTGRTRRSLASAGVMTAVVLAIVTSWSIADPALAQDDEDDVAATIEALEERVSALETQVAELAGGADDDDGDDAPRPTPTGDQDDASGDTRDDDGQDRDADAASGPAGTRDNPIPLGESAEVGDYTVTVLEAVPNATDLVMTENQFNEPPAAGKQFYLVGVEVTYNGTETGQPAFELNLQAVGDQAVAYTAFEASCGVVPLDQFQASELFPGGTVQFNTCWAIDSSDEDSLVMFVEAAFDFDAEPVFFALRED
jgi:hypothetical protein